MMEGDQLGSNYAFPPGFRFHPSDEELRAHYLQNKINSHPLPAPIVAEIDLYMFNPWELPKKALFGEDEWYFFSPRDRKYPNGLRPNRAAASGYWKATGTDKPILTRRGSSRIGVKKALVFYSGRPPRGTRTDWIMNEHRMVDTTSKPSRFKGSMRLDDWVLCRVRYKGYSSKNRAENQENNFGSKLLANLPTNTSIQADIITDYQILASIIFDEPMLHSDMSSANYRGKGNTFASVYEDGFSKMNPQLIIPHSLEYSYFDSLKRRSNEDNQHENLISFHRKLIAKNKIEDPPNKVLTHTDANCYNQNQSHDGILNENTPESSINFQELNEVAYTRRYMQ